jgi:hypothetical protein
MWTYYPLETHQPVHWVFLHIGPATIDWLHLVIPAPHWFPDGGLELIYTVQQDSFPWCIGVEGFGCLSRGRGWHQLLGRFALEDKLAIEIRCSRLPVNSTLKILFYIHLNLCTHQNFKEIHFVEGATQVGNIFGLRCSSSTDKVSLSCMVAELVHWTNQLSK